MNNQHNLYHSLNKSTIGRSSQPRKNTSTLSRSIPIEHADEIGFLVPISYGAGKKVPISSAGRAASRGDICIAEIAFSDGSDIKTRPALVLGTQGRNLVVAPVTSHEPRNQFDIELLDWHMSGLHEPSTVQCGDVGSISRSLILAVLGPAMRDDWRRVQRALDRWFRRVVLSQSSD